MCRTGSVTVRARFIARSTGTAVGTAGPEGFNFIDLFAGIDGLRMGFDAIGGHCPFTSNWNRFSQQTYAANFRDNHPVHGDITQIGVADIPDHDVLLAGFLRRMSTSSRRSASLM